MTRLSRQPHSRSTERIARASAVSSLIGLAFIGGVFYFYSGRGTAQYPQVVAIDVKNRTGSGSGVAADALLANKTNVEFAAAPASLKSPPSNNEAEGKQGATSASELPVLEIPRYKQFVSDYPLSDEQLDAIEHFRGNQGVQAQILEHFMRQKGVYIPVTSQSNGAALQSGEQGGTSLAASPQALAAQSRPQVISADGTEMPADPYRALRERGDVYEPRSSEEYLSQVVSSQPK